MIRLSMFLTGALLASAVFAAPPDKDRPPPADPRDMSGVWSQTHPKQAWKPQDGSPLPLTPVGQALYDKRQAVRKAGLPSDDPAAKCWPRGIPSTMMAASPMQIVQQGGRIAFIIESDHDVQRIYLDETQPKHLAPSFMGHAVGHWEGDTLVVETEGFPREGWIDDTGTPASERLRVTQRYRKIDGGRTLENLVTIDDPVMYTRPWTSRMVYKWRPDMRMIEYICEENMREPPTQ